MPVLARGFEAAGLSTVTVTMMPEWVERVGIPRAAGVEFPFGHTLGLPDDREMQLSVIRDALRVLAEAGGPDTVVHLPYQWPQPQEVAYKDWQPPEPSPIIAWARARAQARRAQGGS